jgi:hypothetical protein
VHVIAAITSSRDLNDGYAFPGRPRESIADGRDPLAGFVASVRPLRVVERRCMPRNRISRLSRVGLAKGETREPGKFLGRVKFTMFLQRDSISALRVAK